MNSGGPRIMDRVAEPGVTPVSTSARPSILKPAVTAFFDKRTCSVQYVVSDPETKRCAIMDPVLDFEPKIWRDGDPLGGHHSGLHPIGETRARLGARHPPSRGPLLGGGVSQGQDGRSSRNWSEGG